MREIIRKPHQFFVFNFFTLPDFTALFLLLDFDFSADFCYLKNVRLLIDVLVYTGWNALFVWAIDVWFWLLFK